MIEVIKITKVPAGVTFNTGSYDAANDVWEFTVSELVGLEMIVPDGVVGKFDLNVESVAFEQNTNGVEKDTTDNRASAFDTIEVDITYDDEPELTGDLINVDETNLSPTTSANGSVVADFGRDAPGSINGNGTYDIGGVTSGTEQWNGRIDELSVWDRELTSAEVTTIYNSGSGKQLNKNWVERGTAI